MPTTKSEKSVAMLRTIGERVSPPFTEAERDLAERKVADGADPVAAADAVIDQRVALASRAVRARDGDPYPPLESLLDDDDRKARARARYEEETGDATPATPDAAREQAGIQEAQATIARLTAENKALQERVSSDAAGTGEVIELRQKRADLEAEVERLREALAGSGAAPAGDGGTTGREQTGTVAGNQQKVTGKNKDQS